MGWRTDPDLGDVILAESGGSLFQALLSEQDSEWSAVCVIDAGQDHAAMGLEARGQAGCVVPDDVTVYVGQDEVIFRGFADRIEIAADCPDSILHAVELRITAAGCCGVPLDIEGNNPLSAHEGRSQCQYPGSCTQIKDHLAGEGTQIFHLLHAADGGFMPTGAESPAGTENDGGSAHRCGVAAVRHNQETVSNGKRLLEIIVRTFRHKVMAAPTI